MKTLVFQGLVLISRRIYHSAKEGIMSEELIEIIIMILEIVAKIVSLTCI